MIRLKKHILSNATLKVASLILGTSFWFVLDSHHTRTIDLQVPVCFYGETKHLNIETYDQITISLCGKRRDLQTIDRNSLAVHIDAKKLTEGIHPLSIDSSTLFLPSTIKLIKYSPSNCSIKVSNCLIQKTVQENNNQITTS